MEEFKDNVFASTEASFTDWKAFASQDENESDKTETGVLDWRKNVLAYACKPGYAVELLGTFFPSSIEKHIAEPPLYLKATSKH